MKSIKVGSNANPIRKSRKSFSNVKSKNVKIQKSPKF